MLRCPCPITERFLNEHYYPSGLSIADYSRRLSVKFDDFWKIVTRKGVMDLKFIYQMSKVTSTDPERWIYEQNDYLFERYLKYRRVRVKISPIIRNEKVETRNTSPSIILRQDYINPTYLKVKDIERLTDTYLYNVLHRDQPITAKMARNLGTFFNTGTKYWFDVQSRYDLFQYMEDNPQLTYIKMNDEFRFELGRKTRFKKHPGKFVLERYFKGSGISLIGWSALFHIAFTRLNKFIKGHLSATAEFAVKLARQFNTRIDFWLEMQNMFDTEKAEKKYQNNVEPYRNFLGYCSIGLELLNFLRELNWDLVMFMKHLNVGYKNFRDFLYGRCRVDFELSIRIGEALNMDPRYWNKVQIQNRINLRLKKTGNRDGSIYHRLHV